jgi:hypothetical protein
MHDGHRSSSGSAGRSRSSSTKSNRK